MTLAREIAVYALASGSLSGAAAAIGIWDVPSHLLLAGLAYFAAIALSPRLGRYQPTGIRLLAAVAFATGMILKAAYLLGWSP